MSDSESSEELEVKVELEHEAKVRELIERAKQILPGYSVHIFSLRKNHSSISTKSHSWPNPSSLIKWTSLSNNNASLKKKERLRMTGTILEKENALLHKVENLVLKDPEQREKSIISLRTSIVSIFLSSHIKST